MARWFLIVVIAVHGLIHLIGVAVYLRLAAIEGLSYPTSLLDGALPAPPLLVRVLGVLWLAAALAFLGAAAALFFGAPSWRAIVLAASVVSFGLCALGWPDAEAGVFVNVGLVAVVIWSWNREWP
jgi:hypothetical protein